MEKRDITGRPFENGWVIAFLEDDELYTGAKIAKLMLGQRKNQAALYDNLRQSLNSFSRGRQFKTSVDGSVTSNGNWPAWFGSTWKAHVEPFDLNPPTGIESLSDAQDYWRKLATGGHDQKERPKKWENTRIRVRYSKVKTLGKGVFLAAVFPSFILVVILYFQSIRVKQEKPGQQNLASVQTVFQESNKKVTNPGAEKSSRGFADYIEAHHSKQWAGEKFQAIPIEKSPKELSAWQTPPQEKVIVSLEKQSPTTIYLLNLRGAGLFPD